MSLGSTAMASNEELEHRIEALEEKVRRMERVLDDPTRGVFAVRPLAPNIAHQNDAVMFDFVANPPLVRIAPRPTDPRILPPASGS